MRLIDVGSDTLRLLGGEEIKASSAERPQYSALSYCWAPPEDADHQTKTKKKDIKEYSTRLDFHSLQPVLQDAVKTTRNLDIPYLWVDSLCILQDDISDWQSQCAQMDKVYGNACVTLIAASSETCMEGFLHPTRYELRFPYRSAPPTEITGSFMLYFTHVCDEVQYFMESAVVKTLHDDLNFSRWARRGWTCQEETMAGPRIVFGSSDVYFARNGQYMSKDGVLGYVEPKLVASNQSADELHLLWESIIRRYSSFALSSFSKPRDLLPALSGLAAQFNNRLESQYVAGCWVDRLHSNLLWYRSCAACPSINSITQLHSRTPYLVPTWSSLTRGEVTFNLQDDTLHEINDPRSETVVHDVHAPLDVPKNPYGAINGASVTLEGSLLDLSTLSWSEESERLVGSLGGDAEIWFENHDFSRDVLSYGRFIIFDINTTPEQRSAFQDYKTCHDYWLHLDFQADSGRDSRREDSELEEIRRSFDKWIMRMAILLVASEERYDDYSSQNRKCHGLILLPLEAASERSFLRVGAFQPNPYGYKDSLPCLKRLMKEEKIRIF